MSFHQGGYADCGLLDEYMLMVLESQKGVKLLHYKIFLHALSCETVLRRGKEYVTAHCCSSAICLRYSNPILHALLSWANLGAFICPQFVVCLCCLTLIFPFTYLCTLTWKGLHAEC